MDPPTVGATSFSAMQCRGSVLPEPSGHIEVARALPKPWRAKALGAIAHSLDKTLCVSGLLLPRYLCRMAMAEPCRGALCDLRSVRRGWKGQDYLFHNGFRADVQSQSFDQGFPQGHAGAANSRNPQICKVKTGRHSRQNFDFVLVSRVPRLVPKWSKIHQKYIKFRTKMDPNPPQMGPCGPLVGLGAPLCPPGTSKSRLFGPFRVPLGSLWAPRGAIWAPLGVILATFVCQK